MKRTFLLGVDLGTTATKAALYRPTGELVSEARIDVPLHNPHPGVVEQDADDFYRSAACAVRECLAACSIDSAAIAAIAFDSQMAGLGTIGETFRAVTPFDSWLDMRCQPYIEWLRKTHSDRITELTGCPPTCDHGPKMLWLMHERPADYQRIAKFVMPACYVAGRLAGIRAEQAFIDYTFLHFTALADTERGSWSVELCEKLGVDPARLPRIVAPWEVIGEVAGENAAEFGLAAGTLVAAGCGDTAAGALGAGVVSPGMLLDTAGTASVLACCTDRFVTDRRHRALLTMRSVVNGIWMPLAYVAGGGLALRWFRDQFLPGDSGYERLTDLAATAPPGCDGLLFSPHLGGRICPAEPEMRGAWVGFSWSHGPAHFARAILEGIGCEYSYYLSILRQLVPHLELQETRVIGGGATNALWNQIKADVVGVPYRKGLRAECATWGSALVAGAAAGIIGDLGQAALARAPVSEAIVAPDFAAHERYTEIVQCYLAWQECLQKGFSNHA